MTKPIPASKKPRKQHSPEFRDEALKLAYTQGMARPARIHLRAACYQTSAK